MPLGWVAITYAAQNHVVSGSLERCRIVPAVTEVWRPQRAHSKVHGLLSSRQALLPPQPGQTKPSGQRAAARYSAQVSSSPKRCSNSVNERGKSARVAIRINYVGSVLAAINKG